MLRKFVCCLLVIFSSPASAWIHGSDAAPGTPPCDIVTCAEAYSVTRALKSSYSGPLFQISKSGGATLDIGQVAGHADMTTWSAFCGGVQSNCWYTKIYAQIHTTTNDVANWSGPSNTEAPFTIEAATGLPIVISQKPFTIPGNGSDVNATGINGHGAATSVYYVGRFSATSVMCCGAYGIYHRATDPNTLGTDFGIMPTYGQGTFSHCGTATTYCLQIDEEGDVDGGDVGASPIDLIGVITFDPTSSGTVKGYINNHATFTRSPPTTATLNPGIAIHLFAGGDLTSACCAIMREGLITNSALTAGQVSTLTSNEKAFYAGVSFP